MTAMYDFTPKQEWQLAMKKGEMIYLLSKDTPTWWRVRNAVCTLLDPSSNTTRNLMEMNE
jgi:hypothetical protein